MLWVDLWVVLANTTIAFVNVTFGLIAGEQSNSPPRDGFHDGQNAPFASPKQEGT